MCDVEVLFEAEGLLEAPRPMPDGSVVFANTTAGGVYRWTATDTTVVVERRRGIGGIAAHVDGGLLVGGRDLLHTGTTGRTTVLAVDGATGLNDMTVASDGSLFVGVLRHRPGAGEAAPPSELLHISPTGSVRVVRDDLLWPNGIGISPDGTRVYVAEFAASRVRVLGPEEASVFAHAPRGECDGLAVDVEGCVWVALGSGGGIARFSADGVLDELIDLAGRFVSSLAFSGTAIYVTTAGALLRLDVGVEGLPVAEARVPVARLHVSGRVG
ncbi:SMP-30/gluconolactonase/LRE family protein [Rhodococcus sp. NPDC127530]|uniref:SMP-30/gluconolactonase/LRE family protein n=1 Tax=unclassified Rhodococcus (in: high G+C Gram-positive bacteria) TaxID=192944 RepID=UPI0036457CD5